MKLRLRFLTIALISATILTGCMPTTGGRYYLQTEEMPNGTVTSVMDSKTNTQVLYITELSLEPPTISVLPVSRLDIEHVSVSPIGGEDVTVYHQKMEDGDVHAVMIREPSPGPTTALTNFDANRNGIAESRSLRMLGDKRVVSYYDLDADGIFDAQETHILTGEPTITALILVGKAWIDVDSEIAATAFREGPHSVSTLDTPTVSYTFSDGAWQAE